MRALVTAALVFALGAPAFAQVKPALPPVVVPAPPPGASSHIFDAMMAIVRAQQANPQAAQTASFAYAKALQQLRAGDVSGADASAISAIGIAGAAAVTPVGEPLVAPLHFGGAPAPVFGSLGATAPAIDAEAFLALARGQLATCPAAAHTAAASDYAAAAKAFAANNWEATRRAAKLVIDRCAQPHH